MHLAARMKIGFSRGVNCIACARTLATTYDEHILTRHRTLADRAFNVCRVSLYDMCVGVTAIGLNCAARCRGLVGEQRHAGR